MRKITKGKNMQQTKGRRENSINFSSSHTFPIIPFILSYLYCQNHQGSLTYFLIFCSQNWVVLIIRSDINFLYSNELEYVYLVYFGTFWFFCLFVF